MSALGPRESIHAMEKSPDAFRTISEVADDLDLPQHVLRFWETRFTQIKPLKRGGGRRYYRPDDVDLLKGIRHLLYGEGYTIKGVQRILKEDGIRFVQSIGRGEQSVAPPPGSVERGSPEAEIGEAELRTSRSSAADASTLSRGSSGETFSGRDIERLKSALDELLECERVLAALDASKAGEDEVSAS
jgi:DNA-binding transcriptional MerR regulator